MQIHTSACFLCQRRGGRQRCNDISTVCRITETLLRPYCPNVLRPRHCKHTFQPLPPPSSRPQLLRFYRLQRAREYSQTSSERDLSEGVNNPSRPGPNVAWLGFPKHAYPTLRVNPFSFCEVLGTNPQCMYVRQQVLEAVHALTDGTSPDQRLSWST